MEYIGIGEFVPCNAKGLSRDQTANDCSSKITNLKSVGET